MRSVSRGGSEGDGRGEGGRGWEGGGRKVYSGVATLH